LRFCRFCEGAFLPHARPGDRCESCASRGVTALDHAMSLFEQPLGWARRHGLDVGNPRLVLSATMPRVDGGRPALGFVQHGVGPTITIQSGLPAELFQIVSTHELGHVWVARAGLRLSRVTEEGACEWLAYRFACSLGGADAHWQARRIKRRDDPIYGRGFRQIHTLMGSRAPGALLTALGSGHGARDADRPHPTFAHSSISHPTRRN
jgi:hypothetical protein